MPARFCGVAQAPDTGAPNPMSMSRRLSLPPVRPGSLWSSRPPRTEPVDESGPPGLDCNPAELTRAARLAGRGAEPGATARAFLLHRLEHGPGAVAPGQRRGDRAADAAGCARSDRARGPGRLPGRV